MNSKTTLLFFYDVQVLAMCSDILMAAKSDLGFVILAFKTCHLGIARLAGKDVTMCQAMAGVECKEAVCWALKSSPSHKLSARLLLVMLAGCLAVPDPTHAN